MEKLAAAADLFWTFESVKEHFEKNPPIAEQTLLVHDTSWRTNTYALVTVEVPSSGQQKRIIIDGYSSGYSGMSFYRSGKNCFSPKGQVRLLPYHEAIADKIRKGHGGEIQLAPEDVLLLIEK